MLANPPDDLVERVARALCSDDGNPCGCVTACKIGLAYADKAIALVLEEAARVCERRYMGDNNREDMEARRCAAAIRALVKEHE